MTPSLIEEVPGMAGVPRVRAAFLRRIPGVDVAAEREIVLKRLRDHHEQLRVQAGLGDFPLVTAEQVHGAGVFVADRSTQSPVLRADALVTSEPGVCLGIYVADCAAVYIAHRLGRAIGLVHSGRKGTELNIVNAAVKAVCQASGDGAAALVAAISPCIRPPHYETDFAARIVEQLQECGVGEIHDTRTCTASHPERYYSYRRESGRTGRLLALLAILPE